MIRTNRALVMILAAFLWFVGSCRSGTDVGDSLARIEVTGNDSPIPLGYGMTLIADVFSGQGQRLSGEVSWSSTNPLVATITPFSEQGAYLTTVGTGTTTIAATFQNKTAHVEITVTDPIPPPPPLPPAHAFLWTEADGMIDLGGLPGATESTAAGINDSSQVVGASGGRAFIWSRAQGMVEITGLPGATSSAASRINNSGEVIGVSMFGPREAHTFRWTAASGAVDLGALLGAPLETYPGGINSAGEVVGTSGGRPFRWTQATGMEELSPHPVTGRYGKANAVNDNGQIAGTNAYKYDNFVRAILWGPGTEQQDVACCNASAGGINNAGAVVGSVIVGGPRRAFLWTPDAGLVHLPLLSGTDYCVATGVNEADYVVGWCVDANLTRRAFIWSQALGVKDLGNLPGLQSSDASQINNKGEVVGRSR